MGGLGNQMFQYAAGRALAIKLSLPLKLDTSFLEANPNGAYTKRHLELGVFNVAMAIASPVELKKFQAKRSMVRRLINKFFPGLFQKNVVVERGTGYQQVFDTLTSDTYLEGFWQNERYFKRIRKNLLDEFKMREQAPEDVDYWFQKINTTHSVSLHVRRGDYVNLKSAADFHGICSLEYYQTSLQFIQQRVGSFDLFVFSDDIAWCREHIRVEGNIHFVTHQQEAAWDIMLMSNCRHHIIANSSFSWWGAWLNRSDEKIVVMPKAWFKHLDAEQLGIKAEGWLML